MDIATSFNGCVAQDVRRAGAPWPKATPLRAARPHASEDWQAMLEAVHCRLLGLAWAQGDTPPTRQGGTSASLAVSQCAHALSQLQQAIDPDWGQGQRLALDLLRTRVALVQALICAEPAAFALKPPHAMS